MEETESQGAEQLFQVLTTSNESRTRIKLFRCLSLVFFPFHMMTPITFPICKCDSFCKIQVYIYHIHLILKSKYEANLKIKLMLFLFPISLPSFSFWSLIFTLKDIYRKCYILPKEIIPPNPFVNILHQLIWVHNHSTRNTNSTCI